MRQRRDQRPYNVHYYRRHRTDEIERVMRRQRETLEWLRELRRVPCADCGGTFPPHAMDFDHRDPTQKRFAIAGGKVLLKNRDELVAEIAKCEIVCANCHAIRTYALQMERKAERRAKGTLRETPRRTAQRTREARTRDFLLQLRERPCADCGQRFPPYVMEFDHRNPSTKAFLVANSWCRSRERILEEAAKCDIVCRNCHRVRTFRRTEAARGSSTVAVHLPSKQATRVRFPSPAHAVNLQMRLIQNAVTHAVVAGSG